MTTPEETSLRSEIVLLATPLKRCCRQGMSEGVRLQTLMAT